MKTISVGASRSYDVLVGSGLLAHLGSVVKNTVSPAKAAIISDSNVWPLYGETAQKALQAEGIHTVSFVFPAGEQSKCATTYLQILEFLAQNKLQRSDCVIALGGGVVGDITGFAAATYLRGISYIQAPTTLLAAVDSSVGGKTAIDLSAGTLATLPESVFRDGCAEVIKYSILYDPALFSCLQEHLLAFPREDVIARCVALKRDVVALDEFDKGIRQMLNLGHTFGHSIELLSQYSLSHGQAVAIGMGIIARSASAAGLCDKDTADMIVELLQAFGLPVSTHFSPEEISAAAKSDKKCAGDCVNLIVPLEIGKCKILPTELAKLTTMIEAGM